MKPVDQSITCKDSGDCMRAAIASLLNLDLEAVPHFLLNGRRWWDVMYYFIYVYGYKFQVFDGKLDVPPDRTISGYTYATVRSRNYADTTHAVIIDCNKICVHDPSPMKNYEGVDLNGSDDLVQFYCFDKVPLEV